MLTGSVAAAWYGAGRATMDIAFVIDPTAIAGIRTHRVPWIRSAVSVSPRSSRSRANCADNRHRLSGTPGRCSGIDDCLDLWGRAGR
jgi:hypothetical protein